MAANDQNPKNLPDVVKKTPCVDSDGMKMLAIQLTITQLNSRHEMSPEVQAEFKREFALYEPEAIEDAFRAWRRVWPHNPSISDIRKLIDQAEAEKRRQQDEARMLKERNEIKQAREEGKIMGLEQLREILAPYVEKKKPAYVPLSEEELKRRRDEQLKAVKEKFGEGKANGAGNDPRSNP